MKYTSKIKKDFEDSWNDVESFFEKWISHESWSYMQPMLSLIEAFREKGLHAHLRAGQSLYFLMLTRARMHNGNYITSLKIVCTEDSRFEVYRYTSGKPEVLSAEDPFENDQFNQWIEELMAEEIK